MRFSYLACACGVGLFGIVLPLTVVFWYLMIKKGWASWRLITVVMDAIIIGLGVLGWVSLRETWIIWATVFLVLWTTLVLLTLPPASPGIVKRLGIQW